MCLLPLAAAADLFFLLLEELCETRRATNCSRPTGEFSALTKDDTSCRGCTLAFRWEDPAEERQTAACYAAMKRKKRCGAPRRCSDFQGPPSAIVALSPVLVSLFSCGLLSSVDSSRPDAPTSQAQLCPSGAFTARACSAGHGRHQAVPNLAESLRRVSTARAQQRAASSATRCGCQHQRWPAATAAAIPTASCGQEKSCDCRSRRGADCEADSGIVGDSPVLERPGDVWKGGWEAGGGRRR